MDAGMHAGTEEGVAAFAAFGFDDAFGFDGGFDFAVDVEEQARQGGEVFDAKHVGAVAERFFGVGMDFEEDAVDAGGDGGAGERCDELTFAAGLCSKAARRLDGMRGVKDDRVAEQAH